MKKHIILFIAIFFASVLHAQTINIRGTVTDTSNETLPGVSITIKGTQTGTVSDANGNYSIRAQRGNVLEFTFVGMVKQSVTVGKQNVINIQMAADAINLDEVVAIGYGIAKKSDLTGAVASIKSENLTNSKVGTVTTALQGLAAGVQVTTGSVKPGGDASVVIRGVGSLRAGSEPLQNDVLVNFLTLRNYKNAKKKSLKRQSTFMAKTRILYNKMHFRQCLGQIK